MRGQTDTHTNELRNKNEMNGMAWGMNADRWVCDSHIAQAHAQAHGKVKQQKSRMIKEHLFIFLFSFFLLCSIFFSPSSVRCVVPLPLHSRSFPNGRRKQSSRQQIFRVCTPCVLRTLPCIVRRRIRSKMVHVRSALSEKCQRRRRRWRRRSVHAMSEWVSERASGVQSKRSQVYWW